MQFNLVNNKEMLVFLCIGSRMEQLLSSQRSQAYVLRSGGLRVATIWSHVGKSVVQPLLSLSSCLFFSSTFCLPSIPPLCFVFLSFFFFFSFHCYHSVTGAWMSLCVRAHGWIAGIASHGSILLSRGWLIKVEAPGHSGHPLSTQLDAAC